MNRIASRTAALLLFAAILIGGFGFFLVEYLTNADQWVISPGSPHVYNGGNIGCGVVVDREGTLLLDMNDGRMYSDSSVLRQATVHWIGDRYGSINAAALPHYAAELAGFDMLNGVYSYGGSDGVAELTLSGSVQAAALEAMGEHKGTVAVFVRLRRARDVRGIRRHFFPAVRLPVSLLLARHGYRPLDLDQL